MPWYKAGTVSVTQNSNAVIGVGTAFIANSRVGDAFKGPDGRWYEVVNIASDTALAISPPYAGPTAAGAGYSITPVQGYVKASADRLSKISAEIGSVDASVQAAAASATAADQSAVAAGQLSADAGAAAQSALDAAQQADGARIAAQTSEGNAASSAAAAESSADRAEQVASAFDQNAQAKTDTFNQNASAAQAAIDASVDLAGDSASAAAASAAQAAQSEQNVSNKANSGVNSDITELRGLTVALSVAQGGTGGKTPSTARGALGAARSGANDDITSLTALTTALTIAQGGTGAKTLEGAKAALGITSPDPWASQPLGVPIAVMFDTAGNIPPQDKGYRYIKLTASDTYNSGMLTGETITGSGAQVEATAVLNLTASIFNGATISLINTDRRVIRAGNARAKQDDALQNITGSVSTKRLNAGEHPLLNATGAMSISQNTGISDARATAATGAVLSSDVLTFDASAVARTDIETRAKNIGATYYMRVL